MGVKKTTQEVVYFNSAKQNSVSLETILRECEQPELLGENNAECQEWRDKMTK